MTVIDAQRQELETLEQEIMTKQAKLNELRREVPRETVQDYLFKGQRGDVRLSELFGDHRDLIVIHNMGRCCAYCTLWADCLNGMIDHIQNRTALAIISPDTPEVQQEFAKGRGWRMQMVSNADSSFTGDMGYIRPLEGTMGEWPGFSTFHREDDGSVVRVAHGSFGPGDPYCGIWHLFGVLADGVNDWTPKFCY